MRRREPGFRAYPPRNRIRSWPGVSSMSISAYSNAALGTFAELLIDCEEDRTLRAVLVGLLREGDN